MMLILLMIIKFQFGGGRTVDGKNRVIIYDFSLNKYSEYLSDSLYKYDVRTPKEGLSEILHNKDLFVEDLLPLKIFLRYSLSKCRSSLIPIRA